MFGNTRPAVSRKGEVVGRLSEAKAGSSQGNSIELCMCKASDPIEIWLAVNRIREHVRKCAFIEPARMSSVNV